MVKVVDVIEKLEQVSPLETQEVWDNSGWQINLGNKETKKILLALNVTEKTVDYAVKQKCDLIISHHPLIFSPLKCIKNKAIISAIQNNIQVYSAHTNFDKSSVGTTQTLVDVLKSELDLKSIKDINDFVKVGTLKSAIKSSELLDKVKKALNLSFLRFSNSSDEIKRVAFCAGAGADFANDVVKNSVDCYITADVKYHQALDCPVMLVDVGHYESEIVSLSSIKKLLESLDVDIILSNEEPIFEII